MAAMHKQRQKTKPPIPSADRASPSGEEKRRLKFGDEVIEFAPTAEEPIQVLITATYEEWINSVADVKTNARITNGVEKIRRGLFGDWKDVGNGVFELRLDFGPGYRVYYAKYGRIVVVLLGGGDKGTQQKDIANAQQLWEGLKDEIKEI